ncbi:MAG: hypothetical protein IJE72_01565 [Clostridia bacterium]|nr:hypothetical protein [Clostridia bacterium]
MKKAKKTRGILPLVLLLAVAFVLEVLFSNLSCFAYTAGGEVKDYVSPEVDNVILYDNNRTVQLDIPSFKLNSVSFDIRLNSLDSDDTTVRIAYMIYDENSAHSPAEVRNEVTAVGIEPRRVTAHIRSQGNADRLEIIFRDCNEEIIVSDIVINPSYEFSFNSARFCILYVLACLIYVLNSNGNAKKLRNSLNYTQAAYASAYVCVFSAVVMWILNISAGDGNYIPYPLENAVESYNPYIQQFDAFMKGQLHFDVEPTAELLALENPYNPDMRNGIYYLYDRAFFEGKYYSYFGIAPIILIYFPFYFITRGLPVDSTVTLILSLITAIHLPLAVVEWAKLRNRNIRPWLTAVCGAGAFFASSALIIQRGFTPFYYIASLSGMAFVSVFAFWLFKALGAKETKKRILYFTFSGLGFALAFLSRVNSVISPAIMIAVFVLIYSARKIKEKEIISLFAEMSALALPVIGAAGFFLYYNYARFGNPLQFGADYQLTIADASLYELGAEGIIPSIIHYFLQPFGLLEEFPYIGFDYLRLSDYGRYVYIDSNFGIFALPFMFALLFSVFIFKNSKASKEGKALLASGIISLFVTAFANFCLGGVIFRYTSDISLVAAFLSAVILMEICTDTQQSESKKVSGAVKGATVVLSAVTSVISLASCVQLNGNLVAYDPNIYNALKNFFVIWS